MRNSKFGKNLIVVLLPCCLVAVPAYGDTTTGLSVDGNGNVGIGTITPQARLEVSVSPTSYLRANEPSVALLNLQGSFMNAPLLKIDGTGTADFVSITDSSSPVLSIKDGGNIGIGTTTPAAKLEVNVATSWNGIRLKQDNNTNGDGGKIYFLRTRNGGSANIGDFIGAYGFMFKDSGGNLVNGAEINSVITDNSAGSVDARMNFLTAHNGAWGNRMTLMSNGYLGIGTTSPQYTLDVSGYVRATNVSVSSDIRLKENVQPISDALDRLAHLQGVSFNWKDKTRGETAQMGVVAQDVENVFPEAVTTDSEGYKSVYITSLVGPLVEAVKQLKTESDNLRAKSDSLEAENDQLRARLEALEKKVKE